MTEQRIIATPEFIAAHPELHHYTDEGGLRGIVQSNTLWASHFAGTNDKTEVVLLTGSLIKAFAKRYFQILRELRDTGPYRLRRQFERRGGIKNIADDFSENYILSTVADMFLGFKEKNKPPHFEPYILSFCTHAADREYERDHGLLSQWRGYSGLGGYCIVFDTKELCALLDKEIAAGVWHNLRIGAAHYVTQDIPLETAFPTSLTGWDQALLDYISNRRIFTPIDDVYELIWFLAYAKHQGFIEEREVRVVALPMGVQGPHFIEGNIDQLIWPEPNQQPKKAFHIRSTTRGDRRYVVMFENFSQRLPIKRVIVGPSMDQKKSLSTAKTIVGPTVPVHISRTPFIG